VQDLPSVSSDKLPFQLRGREFRDGRFFLSKKSTLTKFNRERLLSDYDDEISDMLNQRKFDYQKFRLALRPISLKEFRIAKSFYREEDFRHRRPPPRHRGDHLRPPPLDQAIIGRKKPTQELVLSIQLPSGTWFNGIVPHSPIESLGPRILFSTVALLSITLLGVAFFMRRITRPLSAFADAADEFGRGNIPDELSENGPDDIRKAAQAFNRMQRRLRRTLDTQRNMLRAVGHDLRTPLTSLRIRSEMLPEESQREKIIATIDDMTAMTEEILSWTKNAAGLEEPAAVDLHSLLSSIVDDYSDQGQNIALHCNTDIVLKVRRLSMKRALSNVINNAIKYGHSADVSVEENHHSILIHIDDQGPGIPEHLLADALKPFVRLEASRNKDTGGSGLGLSITETIVQAEGGKLLFVNLKPSGLRVTLSLPR
jgi:signal transduction histidine kinase